MAHAPLTIAFFASPEDQHTELILQALTSQGHDVRQLITLEDLRYLEDVEFCSFEAILFGPHFGDTVDAQLSLIRQLRIQPDLLDMPLIVVSAGDRSRFHNVMYDLGVDFIVPPSNNPIDIVHAFRSLLGKRDEHRRLLESAKFTLDSEMQILQAFSLFQEPVIVLNPNLEVRWMNAKAELVLGFSNADQNSQTGYLSYLAGAFRATEKFGGDALHVHFPMAIETLNGVTDWWDVESQAFFSTSGNVRGHVARLAPQIKRRLSGKRISQISQLESMALLTAACAHSVMEKTQSGIVVGPYRQIERFLGQAPQEVNVNAVVTSLLEYLDPVIDPELSIKVSIPHHTSVTLPFGDCFQLLGHMLFTCIGFVCGKGEITLEGGDHEPGRGTVLILTAQSITRARMLSLLGDQSANEELQFTNPEHSEEGLQLASRFQRIRELTGRYRTELQLQTKGEELLKLRIALPSRISTTEG